jgi:nucleotide-binding universal stress UspA family protein
VNRILCAVDGSAAADEALEFALSLCRATGASLDVVVAWRHARFLRGTPPPLALELETAERAEEVATAAVQRAASAGVEARPRVALGDAAHAICASADELDDELVVVGRRGHGAVRGALLGSVSRRVVLDCTRPVTVVGARDRDR